jgi:hypothetical protein
MRATILAIISKTKPITGGDRRRLLPALLLAACAAAGCDRLRRGTVGDADPLILDTPCGRLRLTAEQFIDRHFFLEVKNLSRDTLAFFPMRLAAWRNGATFEYQLVREGDRFTADSMRLAPGGAFSYDIRTSERAIAIKGPGLFAAGGRACDLDSLSVEVAR